MEEIGNNYYIIVKPNNLNLVRMIYVNNRHNCYFYNYIYIIDFFTRNEYYKFKFLHGGDRTFFFINSKF